MDSTKKVRNEYAEAFSYQDNILNPFLHELFELVSTVGTKYPWLITF